MRTQVDQSVLSRSSVDQVDALSRKRIISGKLGIIDYFFPLYDQLFQNKQMPKIISYLALLVLMIQFYVVSWWGNLSHGWDFTKADGRIVITIRSFFHLTPMPTKADQPLILFIVYSACFFFTILVYIVEMSIFHLKRRFISWTFYFFHFIIEFLDLIAMIPLGTFIGFLIIETWNNTSLENIVFLVLSTVYYIVITYVLLLTFQLWSHTPYIPAVPLAAWKHEPSVLIIIAGSMSNIISFFLTSITDWAQLILLILHAAVMVVICYQLIYLPYINIAVNTIFFGICCGCFFNDLLIFFGEWASFLRSYVTIIIGIVLGIVGSIVFTFVERAKIKSIRNTLNVADPFAIAEEERLKLLESLKINKSEVEAFYALRVGIAESPTLFLDWSLLKYCVDNFDTNYMICLATQILSYFPGEPRLLNAVFSNATRRRNLTIYQRFLLYEIYRVRTLRTSSSSNEAAERLSELIQTRHRIFDMIRDYWQNIPSTTLPFSRLSSMLSRALVLWDEAIKDFPNSARISEEYALFLVDCASDYTGAIRMKQRCDMIDSGFNFSIDLAFKSLIRLYPHYIKRKIVGIRGNILLQKENRHSANTTSTSSSSSGSKEMMSSFSQNSEIDVEIEEQIGQSMFAYTRMRLALQRALAGRQSRYTKMMKISNLIAFAVFIACFIVFYILVKSWFSIAQESLTKQLYASHSRFTAAIGVVSISLQWAKWLNLIDFRPLILLNENETEGDNYINYSSDLKLLNVMITRQARVYFGDLLTSIASLASTGVNVYQSAAILISNTINITYCSGDISTTPTLGPLASLFAFNGFVRSYISAVDEDFWGNSSYLCFSFSNAKVQTASFKEIFRLFYEDKLRERDEIWVKIMMVLIILPIAMFAMSTVPSCLLAIMFTKEMMKMPVMFRELDTDAKKKASTSLCNTLENNEQNRQQTKQDAANEQTNYEIAISLIVTFLINLAPIAVIIGEGFYCKDVNDRFAILHGWLFHGSVRAPLLGEVTMSLALLIMKVNGLPSKFIDLETHLTAVNNKMGELTAHNDDLILGTTGLEPCYGYDAEFDRYHYTEFCTIEEKDKLNAHDSYRCASLSQDILIMKGYVNDIMMKLNYTRDLNTDPMINLLHLTNNHMFDKIMRSSDRIAAVSIERHSAAMTILLVFFVCGMVLSLLILIAMYYIIRKMEGEYSSALIFIKRVQPQAVVADTRLINYLLNKESEKNNYEMSLSNAVIFNAEDAIICVSVAGTVEIINPSVTKLLGFTPDQLLGQPISSIICPEAQDAVRSQIELMRNGQSALTYEGHTTCVTDNDVQVPCYITINGIKIDNDVAISSLVIILRDETQLMAQQKEAEEAKKQSENLLFQILPQDIVLRLNQGEKDISFTVPSASITFIDIVRFSEYAAALTPQQIMGNLSLVFAAYDENAKRYSTMTKIKLIGDVYMAAAGLFAQNEPPKVHADQILRFGLDCLASLDDINIKLNSNLSVRIGVNSGGPILAGVLGTDKPVFDIISDTINIAARLQSTDVPGQIQISKGTYELVNDLDFAIEPRGEVFLKGKGKQMTYFVKNKISSIFKSTDFDVSATSAEELSGIGHTESSRD